MLISLALSLLEHLSIIQYLFQFIALNSSLDHLSFFILLYNNNFKLVSIWWVWIHWLCKNLACQNESLLQIAIFFVIIFELTDGAHTSFSSGMCLEACIVSTWIGIVELETSDLVPSSIHKSYTKWSTWTELSVDMAFITDKFH